MGAPSKRARKIRVASEFDAARLRLALASPTGSSGVYAWTLEDIFGARNAQMRGQFALAARLAESMRTDDALFTAYENRLAPQRCIKVEIVPVARGKGPAIASEAAALFGQDGVGIHPDTVTDIHGCLVNHGVAFAHNVLTLRGDGSRSDVAVHYWPIEHVRWDAYRQCFMARVDAATTDGELSVGGEIPIVHGDGRWIVFRKNEHEPFKSGALLAAALVWARHAFAIRDWAKSSVAHGSAKVIGELPDGVALQKDGELTAEAAAFVELLRDYASSDAPVGIRPAGSKTEFVSNNSTAWQVFSELVLNAAKAAARIYLGTDGTLGAAGGAPGVDIQALFGVGATLVEGDLKCLERGFLTGTIEPWCALNFGDSKLAPKRRYLLADADADAARASMATRRAAFYADVDATRASGFEVTQAYVEGLARAHGIEAPKLPSEAAKAPSIALAPTDIARVVTVNEARASAGVGPLTLADGTPDPDGRLTVEQFAAKKAADATAQAAPSAGAPRPVRPAA